MEYIKLKKYIYLIIFLLVHAWLGIAVIVATIIYFFNRLIKNIKNENID